MARQGRKRIQNVQREPNGRPKPETRFSPTAIKRLTENAVALASDPRLGTEIGRLLLCGDINAKQAGAGWQWAELAWDYMQAIGATPLQVKPLSLERGARSEAPGVDTPAGEAIAEKDQRTIKRFERAHLVLCSQGMIAESACRRLCEGKGQPLNNYEERVKAYRCLDALAMHFAVA